MGFHRMLMKLIWVGVLLSGLMAAAGVAAHQLARPNCSDRCGGVEIPFPFGTTDGCYLNGYFALTCNQSSGKVRTGNLIVTDISIQEGQLDILMFVAHQCFNGSGMLQQHNKPSLTVPGFTISNTKNVFVAVGCDTYAYFHGFQNNDPFKMGCMSVCQNISNVADHSCSGIGCCQVDIPLGLKNFTLKAYSFNKHIGISSFNPCSYAFVVKQDQFNFSADYLYTLKDNKTLPMVLDWAIGNETCEFAQIKPDYVCGGNSKCYDPSNGYGYRCKCKDGYDGNPYLPLGCQGKYYTSNVQ
jgi:hypothetical protein